jgi:hypothetical protein
VPSIHILIVLSQKLDNGDEWAGQVPNSPELGAVATKRGFTKYKYTVHFVDQL